jgi:hypothetical protein
MHSGKTVFSQIMDFLPGYEFHKCVERYQGNWRVRTFSCLDQFLCMAFAQLTYRESLRDIESCLRSMNHRLYHMGIRGRIARNTLAKANENRDWRIYADFAHVLIQMARTLYRNEDFGVELDETVYALDATTIDLCLTLFPWAKFRHTKAAVRLHTLLDLRGSIPSVVAITPGNIHEINILDCLFLEPGSFYLMDRGYLDFARLYTLEQANAYFIIRAKKNLQARRLYSRPVDKTTGLRYDQTIVLTGLNSAAAYPDKLRRIGYYDRETDKCFMFLTNNFLLSPGIVPQLYQHRWKIELFFKWIKQHLRIKAFFGTSENAVKTQIWIALSLYVLVAVIKKRLNLNTSLYTMLQIFSITAFEKIPLNQVFTHTELVKINQHHHNQLQLFDF